MPGFELSILSSQVLELVLLIMVFIHFVRIMGMKNLI